MVGVFGREVVCRFLMLQGVCAPPGARPRRGVKKLCDAMLGQPFQQCSYVTWEISVATDVCDED